MAARAGPQPATTAQDVNTGLDQADSLPMHRKEGVYYDSYKSYKFNIATINFGVSVYANFYMHWINSRVLTVCQMLYTLI